MTSVMVNERGTMLNTMIALTLLQILTPHVVKTEPGGDLDYCLSESFKPRCLRKEVILMKSAAFGRMRIGRCITAEEISGLGPIVGEDPRYFGCSADVLSVMDRKCSGKTECEIRVFDISKENIKPCYPGLNVYLEAVYECINIVDEERSCVVDASKNPVHIIGSPTSLRICGTQSSPWTIEAPVGQKLTITLLDFASYQSGEERVLSGQSCHSYGVIMEKIRKRNATICADSGLRELEIFRSVGNIVQIILHLPDSGESPERENQFLLKFTAVGCSDIIPPEDTWLKRNNDVLVIGCYSSRNRWQLNCEGGEWIGVLGNCSHDVPLKVSTATENIDATITHSEEVLAIVAIGGFTIAICLAIACIGAVCLRRLYFKIKKQQEFKTSSYQANSTRDQHLDQRSRFTSDAATEVYRTDMNGFGTQRMPTYSIFVGEKDFSEAENSTINLHA